MNIVIALKDHVELERLARPLTAAGHQVTPVTRYSALLRTLGAMRADAVLLEWGFDGAAEEALIKSVRGPEPDGPPVIMLIPDRWPAEAGQAFAWGAHDLVRRPVSVPELMARLDWWTGDRLVAGGGLPGVLAAWAHHPFWRNLEDIVTAELAATVGVALVRGPVDPSTSLAVSALSRLTLPVEGLEIIVGVGVDLGDEVPLAAALLGGPPEPELLGDAVAELTNVAAGALKRSAYASGKVFTLGLPTVHSDARTLPLERQWRARGDNGIVVHCVAAARSSRPEVVLCGNLREGMVVTANVVGANGVLLAAQGTCLTERSVQRLRSMLGDRHAVEVTLPSLDV
jgi:CheY-like chemotaxis protein